MITNTRSRPLPARRPPHGSAVLASGATAAVARVLHVITCLDTGGANMALCRLIEQGAAGPDRHDVLSLMPGGALRPRLRAAGAEIEDLGLRRGQVAFGAALHLAAAIRRRRPDVLQGWTYHGNLAATVASLGAYGGVPVVWGIRHSILDLSDDKPMTRALIRIGAWLSRSAAAIVYCSRASAGQHEQIGYRGAGTVVIPNGFDCERWRPRPEVGLERRRQLAIPAGRIVIGHVGRFAPVKDHGTLIAAAARLASEGVDLHLVLVGGDVEPVNPALAAAVRAAGLGERICLLGERSDVPELMCAFDLLALCSASEAFPNVLGEAMACGLPCVASDVGDCAWIVDDTGVVVPPRDPVALARGLRALIEAGPEARRSLGSAARARVMRKFEISSTVQQYHDLYRSLCRQR